MPKITITVEDIKATLTMEAGWKKAKLIAMPVEPSAKKDSMNYKFTFEIENEPGDIRKLIYNVNDKNKKMFTIGLIAVYEAVMNVTVSEDKSLELEPETWIGLECWVEMDKTIYNGRPQNSIVSLSATQPF